MAPNDEQYAIAARTEEFKKVFPERSTDCGIAEANMVGIAAGLSTCVLDVWQILFSMMKKRMISSWQRN